MHLLYGREVPNGKQTVYIGTAHIEGASIYSFSVLAELSTTMFEQPTATASKAIEHVNAKVTVSTPF